MPEFVVAVREHESLSYLFSAYLVEPKGKRNYIITQRATLADAEKYPHFFTPGQKEILRIIDSYTDQHLMKIFAKKQVSHLQFLKSLNRSGLSKRIRPFLEKKLVKIYQLAVKENVRIFHKTAKYDNFFADDFYHIHPQAAKTVFNIHRTENGIRYWLSLSHAGEDIELMDRGGFVLSDEPCLLVLGRDIFFFEDTDGKKLKPFFEKKALNIPKSAEKKWFETFAANAVKKYKVKAEGFDIKEVDAEMKCRLIMSEDWKREFTFRLEFHYGKHVFLFGDPQTNKVIFDDKEVVFRKLERRFDKEKPKVEFLKSMGLRIFDKSHIKLDKKFPDKVAQKYAFLQWTTKHLKDLQAFGFEVEQDFHNKIFLTKSPKMDFTLVEKRDWFDIKAVAVFGKFRIPFSELKDTILNGEREYLLPDGTTALIPEEWFAKYSDILQLSERQQDVLRIRRSHFMLLPKKVLERPEFSYFNELNTIANEQNATIELPDDIRAELRPYQKIGFAQMYRMQSANLGMCLADDMGLGKTLQTITLLQKIKNERKADAHKSRPDAAGQGSAQLSLFGEETPSADETAYRKPSLIVMPVSLLHNWKNEIMKFSPFLKVLQYQGSRRFEKVKNFRKYDVILTGYGVVRNDIDVLEKQDFLYVILDESQYIKNPGSQIYKAVIRLQSEKRLVLTGTPIENSLSDLWSQMNFINPGLLGNLAFFRNNIQNPIEKQQSQDHAYKLKTLTAPFILRRTKQQVAKDLPPLSEQVIFCRMSEEQKKIYDEEKSKIRNELLESYESQNRRFNPVRVIQALSKLRQIANHPVLTDSEYNEDSGKFSEMMRAVESITQENHKVLIFSSFVKHLKLFGQAFDKRGMSYSLLTGQTTDREAVIDKFQNDPDIKIFLISLKAGGTGLNLTAADYVFISDPWWNPAAERQAVNRAHRIGQDKKVFVYKYISRQTVEEKILKLQESKQRLSDEIITDENVLRFTDEAEIRQLFE